MDNSPFFRDIGKDFIVMFADDFFSVDPVLTHKTVTDKQKMKIAIEYGNTIGIMVDNVLHQVMPFFKVLFVRLQIMFSFFDLGDIANNADSVPFSLERNGRQGEFDIKD